MGIRETGETEMVPNRIDAKITLDTVLYPGNSYL